MAVHHQMRECLEFYRQQQQCRVGGSRGLGIPFIAFSSLPPSLALRSEAGHHCLSADLCRLRFPCFSLALYLFLFSLIISPPLCIFPSNGGNNLASAVFFKGI